MINDVELSCGPVVMETVQRLVTVYQNEKQQYIIMAVNVVLKLCKLAKQSCNM